VFSLSLSLSLLIAPTSWYTRLMATQNRQCRFAIADVQSQRSRRDSPTAMSPRLHHEQMRSQTICERTRGQVTALTVPRGTAEDMTKREKIECGETRPAKFWRRNVTWLRPDGVLSKGWKKKRVTETFYNLSLYRVSVKIYDRK